MKCSLDARRSEEPDDGLIEKSIQGSSRESFLFCANGMREDEGKKTLDERAESAPVARSLILLSSQYSRYGEPMCQARGHL